MRRVSARHRKRPVSELDTRNPPLPLDSVPVVGPLVSPLVGNGAVSGAQPSSPSDPQPAPTPPPGGGGDNGGSGSGGGNGNGNGRGGGNTPSSSTLPPSGGGTVPPASITPGPTSPSTPPGQLSGSPSAEGASGGGNISSPLSPGIDTSFLGAGDPQDTPVSVATESSANSKASGTSTTGSTVVLSPSQYSQGSNSTPTGTALPSLIPTTAALLSRKQLSDGVIAAIIIICLFALLVLILLIIRRQSIAHRLEVRRQWWSSRHASSNSFSFLTRRSPRSLTGSNGNAQTGQTSSRSSFATNFDQGLMFCTSSPPEFYLGLVPHPPPVAEVRERNSTLISTGGSVVRRESLNSMLSDRSNSDAQYLTVLAGQTNLVPSTPMSVRPFSPSETFAFPKPPVPPPSTVDSFFVHGSPAPPSPQSSATTLVQPGTPPQGLVNDMPPASASTSLYPQTSAPTVALSPFVDATNPSTDPFADPAKPEFYEVEVVRRLFAPSLDDELAVCPGDHVRIFQVFDDGWAFVERLANTENERHERGLIPIDCFRQVDQSLPTFLAEKRVSYASEKFVAIAI